MKTLKEPLVETGEDLVLSEVWRIKDELSAARGHDVHRLFAEARERQKQNVHLTVNRQRLKIIRRKIVPV
jgi:hypothetical protein